MKQSQYKPVLPGDIIFELDAENNLSEAKKSPWHCWIYTGAERPVAHSSAGSNSGSSIFGVTSHTLPQHFKGHSEHKSMHFEVWRINNPELRNIFVGIVLKKVLSCTKDKLKWVKELGLGNPEKINLWSTQKIMFTPYSGMRKKDKNLITEKARFRAARAAIRADEKNLAPLSKIKGVSCHEFMAYSLQAALLQFMFGKNIHELKEPVAEISKEGLKEAKESAIKFFSKSFALLLKEHYQSEDKNVTLKAGLEFCSYNLKAVKIPVFYKFFKTSPLVHFTGNITVINFEKDPELLIVDKDLCKTVEYNELPLMHSSRAELIKALESPSEGDIVASRHPDCCLIC